MTTDNGRDAELREFLRERAGPLPWGVLEQVDATVRRVSQDRLTDDGLPPSRRRSLWVPLAAAAVVLVVIGFVASRWLGLGRLEGIAGGSGNPTASVTLSPSAAATSPAASLLGLWSATDIDGSQMTMTVVVQDDVLSVTYADLRSTVCGGDVQTAVATAPLAETEIAASGLSGCREASPTSSFEGIWTYDSASDQLSQVTPGINGDVTLIWRRGTGASDAFDDTWTSGSGPNARHMTLDGGVGGVEVTYSEAAATRCDGDPFTATGTGAIGTVSGEGRFITVTLTGGCPGASDRIEWKFEYLVDGDALSGPLDLAGEPTDETARWNR